MKRFESIMEKAEKAGGIYETRTFRYVVVHYESHKELFRIRKTDQNTTAANDGWETVYTEI